MQSLFDKLASDPLYLTVGVILMIALLYAVFKRVLKLLLVLVIVFILFLVYVHYTGHSVKDKVEKIIRD